MPSFGIGTIVMIWCQLQNHNVSDPKIQFFRRKYNLYRSKGCINAINQLPWCSLYIHIKFIQAQKYENVYPAKAERTVHEVNIEVSFSPRYTKDAKIFAFPL